ncbi:hypothetical protein BDK51DRAFT_32112, partial [Blyttiomyces helicus]
KQLEEGDGLRPAVSHAKQRRAKLHQRGGKEFANSPVQLGVKGGIFAEAPKSGKRISISDTEAVGHQTSGALSKGAMGTTWDPSTGPADVVWNACTNRSTPVESAAAPNPARGDGLITVQARQDTIISDAEMDGTRGESPRGGLKYKIFGARRHSVRAREGGGNIALPASSYRACRGWALAREQRVALLSVNAWKMIPAIAIFFCFILKAKEVVNGGVKITWRRLLVMRYFDWGELPIRTFQPEVIKGRENVQKGPFSPKSSRVARTCKRPKTPRKYLWGRKRRKEGGCLPALQQESGDSTSLRRCRLKRSQRGIFPPLEIFAREIERGVGRDGRCPRFSNYRDPFSISARLSVQVFAFLGTIFIFATKRRRRDPNTTRFGRRNTSGTGRKNNGKDGNSDATTMIAAAPVQSFADIDFHAAEDALLEANTRGIAQKAPQESESAGGPTSAVPVEKSPVGQKPVISAQVQTEGVLEMWARIARCLIECLPPLWISSDQSTSERSSRSRAHAAPPEILRSTLDPSLSAVGGILVGTVRRASNNALVRTFMQEVAPHGIAKDAIAKQGKPQLSSLTRHSPLQAVEKRYTPSAILLIRGKMLTKLAMESHRVLIYFHLTRKIDLMGIRTAQVICDVVYSPPTSAFSFSCTFDVPPICIIHARRFAIFSDRRDIMPTSRRDHIRRPESFVFLLSVFAGSIGISLISTGKATIGSSDGGSAVTADGGSSRRDSGRAVIWLQLEGRKGVATGETFRDFGLIWLARFFIGQLASLRRSVSMQIAVAKFSIAGSFRQTRSLQFTEEV